MSFREKTAWITIGAILAVSALFWFHVPNPFEPNPGPWVLHSMLASLAVYLIIELIGWLVLRWRQPRDAREPRDEREKLIDLKAVRIAYYAFTVVSLAGMFLALHVAGVGPVGIGMVVVMAFVLSQVVKHGARIVYYRRGS